MGKPMANGIACSAMAIKREVLKAFADGNPYFNTFAGNPVAMAAAKAVLSYLREEHMLEHVAEVGEALVRVLNEAGERHPMIGDIRGTGLFVGVDIVKPGTTEADRARAVRLIEVLREHRVLVSLCGPYGNVLKIRPPLVFGADDLDMFADALEASLSEIEHV